MIKKHNWFGQITTAALVLLTILGGTITATIPGISRPTTTPVAAASDNPTATYLAGLNYRSGTSPIVQVNGGKSTLSLNDWHSNHVEYSHLDQLNRTTAPATAMLMPRNVANDQLRERQTVNPTGWHQKFNRHHTAILNRGHIIAYSLSKGIATTGQYDPAQQSGDQNNPRNLFTQTAFCNQKLQTIYEGKVRHALQEGARVIYRVQPIFQGDDLMAKGVWMQAVGSNGLNFNVYLYNVQPGYRFNYRDGTSTSDLAMTVPTPPGAPHHYDHYRIHGNIRHRHHHYKLSRW